MQQGIAIRRARPADADAVRLVHERAFGQRAEADLVERLERDGDAALSLLAETPEGIVGHVLLSRLETDGMEADIRALALAPLGVVPERQRQGLGGRLVVEALTVADREGWQAVLVLGDPAFYGRFGFGAEAGAGFDCVYSCEHLQARLVTEAPPGRIAVRYPSAFADLG